MSTTREPTNLLNPSQMVINQSHHCEIQDSTSTDVRKPNERSMISTSLSIVLGTPATATFIFFLTPLSRLGLSDGHRMITAIRRGGRSEQRDEEATGEDGGKTR